MNQRIQWKPLLICLAIPLAVGGLSALITSSSMEAFAALRQPPLSPPGWVFPVVWTVLYLLMGRASRRVYRLGAPESRKALTLYYVQLAVNFVWPLLYFRAQEYRIAFWWLLLLLALVLATLSAFYRLDKTAGRLLVPYVAWLLFAAYLNYSIMRVV